VFEVSVRGEFSAAHMLVEIGGKCENLHGHNFKVELHVRALRLTDEGIVVDFRELKRLLRVVLEGLDHKNLNDLTPFAGKSPSSERIAEYIYHEIKREIAANDGVVGLCVDVWESDTSRASYWEGTRR
jgi:6-pyruvoyltetrahydropterin/6-carboxytetrahydropterin synthase